MVHPSHRLFASAMILVSSVAMALGPPDIGEPDRSWLDRIDADVRSCMERGIGFAPPAFDKDLLWFNSDPLTWKNLRGDVVVIQTWTSRTAAGRNWAGRAAQTLGNNPDLTLIALHTPEGAADAGTFLDRRPIDLPVIVDVKGAFCDALGVYERPVNILIDRNGVVRYAGLNQRGLKKAAMELLAEPYDAEFNPTVRPAEKTLPSAEFPPTANPVQRAVDVRGRRAPAVRVGRWNWLNGRPDLAGKVVLIDMWATWCGPCILSIPHLNELAERFRDDLVVIGLSDESSAAFNQGVKRRKLDDFRYYLALDPGGRMTKAMRVTGIPHTIVMSSDGIVRWQGNPFDLKEATVARIVEADKAQATGPVLACRRWADQ